MKWNPSQYLEYEDARLRPALDLLARIDLDAPETVRRPRLRRGQRRAVARTPLADGADRGRGRRTRRCSRARARQPPAKPATRGRQCELGAWGPARPVDVVYSNAALHWLDHHANLFPRLFAIRCAGRRAGRPDARQLSPRRRIRRCFAIANEARWRGRLADHVRPAPVASAKQYYALARAACADDRPVDHRVSASVACAYGRRASGGRVDARDGARAVRRAHSWTQSARRSWPRSPLASRTHTRAGTTAACCFRSAGYLSSRTGQAICPLDLAQRAWLGLRARRARVFSPACCGLAPRQGCFSPRSSHDEQA